MWYSQNSSDYSLKVSFTLAKLAAKTTTVAALALLALNSLGQDNDN
jgi:hypothetical protein